MRKCLHSVLIHVKVKKYVPWWNIRSIYKTILWFFFIKKIPTDDESPCQKLIVAAIDFGSAYSGYAFSFHHEYRSNPLQVNSNNWSSKKSGFMSHKAPTVLLLKPDKTFHSFGYEAEDKYAELMATGQHKEWYYFTGIKMKLMNAMVRLWYVNV